MKLYLKPGACSLSPHIALHEAGLPHEIEIVDLAAKTTASGGNYLDINPKGQVPCLVLDDGAMLTEGLAIVNYIADQAPQSGLAATQGTLPRYHQLEWLSFISSELHKSFGPLFRAQSSEETKEQFRQLIGQKLAIVEEALKKTAFLAGEQFSMVDCYAFTVMGWAKYVNVDLTPFPHIQEYLARIAERPSVKAAIAAEKR